MPLVGVDKTIDEVIRDNHFDMVVIWGSIHDEVDLLVDSYLFKPILLNLNIIAELRKIFAKFGIEFISFFMDNEYDKFGSFTASTNAHIEVYSMNYGYTSDTKFVAKNTDMIWLEASIVNPKANEMAKALNDIEDGGTKLVVVNGDEQFVSERSFNKEQLEALLTKLNFVPRNKP